MGMATSWLKSLFGGKKKCECSDRKRSGCGFLHNPTTIPPNISPSEAAWLWSFYKGVERERLAKLSSASTSDAPASKLAAHASPRDYSAALRIQTLFRAYLARKALRALRALVKLQAHVRGYLVRKRAKETLFSMQALFRAQAAVISQRGRVKLSAEKMKEPNRNFTADCKIVEVDTSVGILKPKSKSRCNNLSQLSDLCDDFVFQRSAPLTAPWITESSGFSEQDLKFSTAHSTPRFGRFYESDFAEQESYYSGNARSRSQSAPKQRPEVAARKKMTTGNMVEPRKSLSGGRIQSPCAPMDDDLGFKNVVAGKLGRSFDERQSWKHNLRYLQ